MEPLLTLLELKADPLARDNQGRTVVHRMCSSGQHEMLLAVTRSDYEFAAGSFYTLPRNKVPYLDIEAVDVTGCTPLFYAVQYGHWSVVKLLIHEVKVKVAAAELGTHLNALHVAAKKGSSKIMRDLLSGSRPPDINAREKTLKTPLHLAVQGGDSPGHVDTITHLVKAKAETNALDSTKNTPLHLAAMKGRSEIAQILMQYGNADPKIKNGEGKSAVDYARELAERATEAGVTNDDDHRHQTFEGMKSLAEAMVPGPPKISLVMMHKDQAGGQCVVVEWTEAENRGVAVNGYEVRLRKKERTGWSKWEVVANRDRRLWTQNQMLDSTLHEFAVRGLSSRGPGEMSNFLSVTTGSAESSHGDMCTFAEAGNEKMVSEIIRSSIDVNMHSTDGFTALHHACKGNKGNICKLLVLAFKAINDKPASYESRFKPIHTAAFHNASDAILMMVEMCGADPNAVDDAGDTPMHVAARAGHGSLCVLLGTQCQADPYIMNGAGLTPLHTAITCGKGSVVRKLVKTLKVPVALPDRQGLSSFHSAAHAAQVDVIDDLIAAKANVHGIDEKGRNIFHALASSDFDEETAKQLARKLAIDCKVDPEIQDNEGLTPLHYAVMQMSPMLVQMLINDYNVKIYKQSLAGVSAIKMTEIQLGKIRRDQVELRRKASWNRMYLNCEKPGKPSPPEMVEYDKSQICMDWFPPPDYVEDKINAEHIDDLKFDLHQLQLRRHVKSKPGDKEQPWSFVDDALPESECDIDREMMKELGIEPDTVYEFRGRAHNIRGWGEWSDVQQERIPHLFCIKEEDCPDIDVEMDEL